MRTLLFASESARWVASCRVATSRPGQSAGRIRQAEGRLACESSLREHAHGSPAPGPGVITATGVELGILTVPMEAAQQVAEALVAVGIRGILNFAPIVLQVPEEVMVNNVNLAIELENLSYFVQH